MDDPAVETEGDIKNRGKRPKGSVEVVFQAEQLSAIAKAIGVVPEQVREEISKDAPKCLGEASDKTITRATVQKHHWILKPIIQASPVLVPSPHSLASIVKEVVSPITSNVTDETYDALGYDLKAMLQYLKKVRRQWRYLQRKQNIHFPPRHATASHPILVDLVLSLEDFPDQDDGVEEDDTKASH